MTFLAPLFLAGIALVAGPIFFHLMRQAPKNRIVFSSTEHLDPTPPQVKQSSRIQHPLLLLLRCLILLLLCAAFARPFFVTENDTPPNLAIQRDIVLAIDQSASMGRDNIWQQTIDRASSLADSIEEYDKLAIVLFSDTTQTILSSDQWTTWPVDQRPAFLTALLEQHAPLPREGYMDLGVEAALEELEIMRAQQEDQGFGEIFLLSDFASGSQISGLAGLEWPTNATLRREAIGASSANNPNVGIRWLGWSEVDEETIAARIALIHEPQDNPLEVTLGVSDPTTNDLLTSPITATLQGVADTILRIELPITQKQSPIYFTISGDNVPFDNELYIAPDFIPELTIAYRGSTELSDTSKAGYFLQKAFNGFASPKIDFQEWTSTAPNTPTAIIVDDTLTATESTVLRQQLLEGATALFIVSDSAQAATLSALTNAPNWSITESTENDALLGNIDFKHPNFSLFADPRFSNFANIRFWNPIIVESPQNLATTEIATFDDNSAALLEIKIGEGTLLVWNHSWDPKKSQWALSSKFVPWLHRFATRAGGASPAPANATLSSTALAKYESFENWRTANSNETLSQAPTTAGLYQADSQDTSRWISLQLPPRESMTAPFTLDVWEKLGLPDFDSRQQETRIAQYAANLSSENAVQTEQRQKLWKWILLAVLILLAAESLVAIRAGNKQEVAA